VSKGTRILIADDEPLIRETLSELLVEEGFDVVGVAADGAEVIRGVEELHPDLVLIDVRMPIMNGIEATRRIHAEHPNTLVVALSAYDDPALAAAAREAGAADYVPKGTPSRELVERIRRAVPPGLS
jgi:DNA-binding NarL/FixJ family response regulator